MQQSPGPIRTSIPAHAFVAALLFLPLRFDDPKRPQDVPVPVPGIGPDVGPGAEGQAGHEDPHVEMKRLFGKIEKELREIDRLLSDASAGGAGRTGTGTGDASKKAADAIERMDELLKKSEERGKSVLAGIDRILELADHPHPPGST